MPIDFFGYDEVGRNNHGVELVDRSGLGLKMLQLFSPGIGIEEDTIPLNEIVVGTDLGVPGREDFPFGTTVFTPDFGPLGARWRWDGDSWVLTDDCWLAIEGSSLGSPISSVNNPAQTFNVFGPNVPFQAPFVPPDWFWTIGRKVEVEFDVTRTTGLAGTTASTDLLLGGANIVHVPWAANDVLQRIKALITVTAAQVATVTTQIVTSGAPTGSPPVPPAGVIKSMLSDIAVSSLGIYHLGFVPGITETAVQVGLFKLINFKARALAG